MSRTGLDAETLARSLRARAGDGSIEWDCEPIQTSVLLDIADMLDENAELVDVLHEVETEAVYAYNCLQQDCITTANSSEHFFKKWWHAECELDRVKDENDKLREQVSSLVGRSFRTADKMSCIEDDNAKLRELVVEVFKCARRGAACETCKVNNDGYACVYIMRELGVEVGE